MGNKIKAIKAMKDCQFQAYMANRVLYGEKNSYLHLLSIYKDAIKQEIDIQDLGLFFRKNVSEKYFYNDKAINEELKIFEALVTRFIKYLEEMKGVIIGSDVKLSEFYGMEIESKADIIIKYPDRVEAVKLKLSSPKLNPNARTASKLPENDLEIATMLECCKKYVKRNLTITDDINCVGSIYYLKGKHDKGVANISDKFELLLNKDSLGIGILESEIEDMKSERDILYSNKKKRDGNKINTVLKKLSGILYFDGARNSNIVRISDFDEMTVCHNASNAISKLEDSNYENSECRRGVWCNMCLSKVSCMGKVYKEIELNPIIDKADVIATSDNPIKEYKPTKSQQSVIDFEYGIARVNAGAGCVDCDTEFFNGNEWKRMAEYEVGEMVLQYEDGDNTNLLIPLINETNSLGRIVNPTEYIKEECETLYHLTDGISSQILSTEHDVVINRFNKDESGAIVSSYVEKVRLEIFKEDVINNPDKYVFHKINTNVLTEPDGKVFIYPYIISIRSDFPQKIMTRFSQIKITPYETRDGYKYCFTVPSGMLILRNDNQMFITGNSGKTKTIVDRYKSLVEKETNPSEILLITFTNAGAREMKERLGKLLPQYKEDDFKVFTFNSFGGDILARNYEMVGFEESPKLITRNKKVKIILNMLRDSKYHDIDWLDFKNPLMNFKNAKGAVPKLISYFSHKKAFNVFSDFEELDHAKEAKLEMLYDEYNEEIWRRGLIDYQDQLNFGIAILKILQDDDKIDGNTNFKHIFTDEYQDTNLMQIKMLQLLIVQYNFESLICVGDTSQSIFSFAGSSPEFMLNFENYFNIDKLTEDDDSWIEIDDLLDSNDDEVNSLGYTDFTLPDNFRSTTQICELANRIDRRQSVRVEKELVSNKGVGTYAPVVEYADTLKDEYDRVAEYIADVKSDSEINKTVDNIGYNDIMIIARTRNELSDIQGVLSKHNIPSQIKIPEYAMDNHVIRLLINYSKYLSNNKHTQYLYELVDFIEENGNSELSGDIDILDELTNNIKNMDIYNVAEKGLMHLNEIETDSITQRDIELSVEYTETISALNKNIVNTFKAIVYQTFEIKVVEVDDDGNEINKPLDAKFFNESLPYNSALNFFETFFKSNREFDTINELTRELSEYELFEDDTRVEMDKTEYDAVGLYTVHSSKGLESEVVVVLLDKFRVENIKDELEFIERDKKIKSVDEEIRLLFTAVTRAEEQLLLLYNIGMDKARNKGEQPYIGKFIKEVF